MASTYPGAVDAFSTGHVDNVGEIIHASSINDLADAVNKVEGHLGANFLKGGFVHNVKTYGAVGNGVADDTTAVQAAIDAAGTAGGGIVFFPPGSFLIGKLTVTASNVWVRGSGQTTKLVYKSGTGTNVAIRVNTSTDLTGAVRLAGFTLSDLYLNMTAATVTDVGFPAAVAVYAVDAVKISGVTVYNTYDTAIDCHACTDVMIDRCTVDTLRIGAGVGNGFNVRAGPLITNAAQWGAFAISNCSIRGVPTMSIHCPGTNASRASITGCHVVGTTDASSYGIVFEAGGPTGYNLTVSGNVVTACGGVGLGLLNTSAIPVSWGRQVAITGNVVDNCDVGLQLSDRLASAVGNQIVNCRAPVIVGLGVAYNESDFVISNNTISLSPGSNSNGITISKPVAGGTLSRIVVADNLISGDQQPPTPFPAAALDSTAGQVTAGTHVYAVSFVTAAGETVASGTGPAVTADATHTRIDVTNIPIGPRGVTSRKLYRSAAGLTAPLLLATIANNTATTYADIIPDASLGAAPPARSASASNYGVSISGTVRDVAVRGNIIQRMGLDGVAVAVSTGTPADLTIQNNRIIDCGYRAVAGSQNGVFIGAAGDQYRILDNRILDTGAGTMAVGIWILSAATNLDVSGNRMTGFPATQFMIVNSTATGRLQARDTYALTDGTNVASDPTRADVFTWTITANAARTLSAPVSPGTTVGTQITYVILNSSGGSFTGPITFNAAFVTTAAFGATIANTKRRQISFQWSGTAWVETSRLNTDF